MGSKIISLGQVIKYPCQRPVGLLYTAGGQKYARVRSGPISTSMGREPKTVNLRLIDSQSRPKHSHLSYGILKILKYSTICIIPGPKTPCLSCAKVK